MFVTRRFDRYRLGHWSGYPICPRKCKHDMQAHITSCNVKETVHVHPESFVKSSISVEHELRGAGACDTCCDRTAAGQEWTNDYVHSLIKLKIEVLDAALSRTCRVWSWRSSIVRDSLLRSSCDARGLRSHASFRSARKIDAAHWRRHVASIGSTI